MKFVIKSPIKASLTDYTVDELQYILKSLTYVNTSVKHLIQRHYNNHFWRSRSPEAWSTHLDGLQKELKKCLVFYDEDEKPYIRPGSIPYLSGLDFEVENEIKYPEPKSISWVNPLPFDLHPEQNQTWQGLIEGKHVNASLCTAFGKSAIILKACQQLGLRACVVAPGKGIFNELVEKFEEHFGKKYVGTFGDGKKKLDRQFTICIGDSLSNIQPGSPEYDFFSNLDALIVDESHTFAAESLETICHGVLGKLPYRLFLSATQVRNDGTLPLLQSIIGKTVCVLPTAEAVRKGYVCPHDFRVISVESSNPGFDDSDALVQKRVHFLNNTNIAKFIARLANGMAQLQGKQTLVLCEELTQLAMLAPLLKVPYALAHSETRKTRLEKLGLEKVKVSESIEKFNKNEVKVLVTTSCCHVGVNIYPTHSTANWIGGSSEIKTKQAAVGRSVRFGHSNPWAKNCVPKDKATIYDFDVEDNRTMKRHLDARLEFYRESESEIKFIKLKGPV